MIDQASINFLVKLSLSCLLLSVFIAKSVNCRAVETQRQYTGSETEATNQIYQYQQHPQEYLQGDQSVQNNFQFYDQQPVQQQQQQYQQQPYHQQSFGSSSGGSVVTNNKNKRRSILSSIMAPFTAMREQGVAMLSASLQSCQPSTFSLWCRFWSMFMGR